MDSFEVNLVHAFDVLWRRKWFLMILVLVCTSAGVYYAVTHKRLYTSQTSLMLLSQQGGGGAASALENVLGGTGIVPGMGGGGGMTTLSKLTALLKSRTFNKVMVEKLNLMPKIYEDLWDPVSRTWKVEKPEWAPQLFDAVTVMQGRVHLEEDGNTGLLMLSVDFTDPLTAQELTNEYSVALLDFYNNNNLTLSRRERLSLGKQLERNKKQLLEVSKQLSFFFSSPAMGNRTSMLDVSVKIDEAPLQLGSVLQGSSNAAIDKSPQADSSQSLNLSGDEEVVKNVPIHIYLEYLSNYQKILVVLQGMFHNQYELANIVETKDELVYQIIDKAELYPIPIKPNRKLIVLVSACGSLALATILIFIAEYVGQIQRRWKRFHAHPESIDALENKRVVNM